MNNLNYYRSELKLRGVKKYKVIGILSDIILSKTLFPKNEDVKFFIEEYFNLTFRDYVFNSRTLIVARITRIVYELDSDELDKMRRSLLVFFEDNRSNLARLETTRNPKTSLTKWIKGFSNE